MLHLGEIAYLVCNLDLARVPALLSVAVIITLTQSRAETTYLLAFSFCLPVFSKTYPGVVLPTLGQVFCIV